MSELTDLLLASTDPVVAMMLLVLAGGIVLLDRRVRSELADVEEEVEDTRKELLRETKQVRHRVARVEEYAMETDALADGGRWKNADTGGEKHG